MDEVVARILDVEGQRSHLMARFARSYLRRLPEDRTASVDALYLEVVDLYRFIDRRTDPISVRAFNPPAADGDDSGNGTVVQVNVADGPFLVDSIVNELEAHHVKVARVLHPVIGVRRDGAGQIIELHSARSSEQRESVQHYELERRLFDADLLALEGALRRVLGDVKAAVGDFDGMVDRVSRMVDIAREGEGRYQSDEIEEAISFLEWLRDDNFVFLGYREYEIFETDDGRSVQCVEGSGLGVLTDTSGSKFADPTPLSSLPPPLAERFEDGDLLVISKTNRPSTVHRRARMDYIGVRHVGPDGRTSGESRLLGLFTSKAYMERASRTPVLRRKLNELAAAEDLIEGSHDYKTVASLFESYPRDDLFGVPVDDLRRLLMSLLTLQERAEVRMFVRRDLLDRSIRVLVAMPRDRYSTTLARRLEGLFLERFNGESVDYNLSLTDDDLAQLYFKVWVVDEGQIPDVAFEELDAEVRALTRSWRERVGEVLAARHPSQKARELVGSWASRFPAYYTTSTELAVAAGDIEHLEELSTGTRPFVVGLQNESEEGVPLTRISLYGRRKLDLSDLTPALEDMGLRVVEEVPTRLSGGEELFVHDFGVLGQDDSQVDLEVCGRRMSEALFAVWNRETESDSLLRLILVGGLDHTQIAILRAYRTYWRRVKPSFTVNYVNETLTAHPEITSRLIALFEMRFRPNVDDSAYEASRYELVGLLDEVASLDQDRILRAFLQLIEATVRTNAYLPGRTAIALKLDSARVPNMPSPQPFAEIFVVGNEVEGIHLRAGRVARGGIRWSDRREDYRTEVLGLLKAQITKNSAIVPTGAKGGFVLRGSDSDDVGAAVQTGYETFVRGLLDLTDNLRDGEVVHPAGVRIHDQDDPYLVVAADKGTATFSDRANRIAGEYGYWLDDAFASGGSTGYDHKALGITARGAWQSLEWHLLELGIDPHADPFTVVGIGDMSGDVFGNGMLGSETLKLVAAFDHRHVFVDPDPDPSLSFGERRRLFGLPGSSWADYDPNLISDGGGVYDRRAKKVSLSVRAQEVLGSDKSTVTPAELIVILLRAPVDVLWNGGVGTYVKAGEERNDQVGDRANDAVRVNGSDLRCRVVVEGGNLGLTQRGRIEYARAGGKINTDFIDNSGGVNCSDREVNLKILFGVARSRGQATREECEALLSDVAEDVVSRILHDSREQAQRLALEEKTSVGRLDAYEQLMTQLEQEGVLDRELEDLPSTEEMLERTGSGVGLSRPELAVLAAYAKRSLVDALLVSELPESPDPTPVLGDYFPGAVTERFGHLVMEHPLRRELIATRIANDLVDAQGSTFVSQLVTRSGVDVTDLVQAYRVARIVSGAGARRDEIEALFGTVDPAVWIDAMNINDRLMANLTRAYLRTSIRADEIGPMARSFEALEERLVILGTPDWVANREGRSKYYEEAGFPSELARRLATLPDLVHAPGIIDISRQVGRSITDVGRVFLRIGQAVQFDALERILASTATRGSWRRWARQTIEDDLIEARRLLAERALSGEDTETSPDDAVDRFLASRAHSLKRVLRLIRSLETGSDHDLSFFMVLVRQIEGLGG